MPTLHSVFAATCTTAGLTVLLTGCCGASPSQRLDLDDACVDGVCMFEDTAAWEAVHGAPDDCDIDEEGDGTCTWNGVTREVHDRGSGPELVLGVVQTIVVAAPYDGSDPHGLAVGVDRGCFDNALGSPDREDSPGMPHWHMKDIESPFFGTHSLGVDFEDDLAVAIRMRFDWEE